MNDSLFNAELRDCARINEIQEQRAPASAQDTAQDDNGVIVRISPFDFMMHDDPDYFG